MKVISKLFLIDPIGDNNIGIQDIPERATRLSKQNKWDISASCYDLLNRYIIAECVDQ